MLGQRWDETPSSEHRRGFDAGLRLSGDPLDGVAGEFFEDHPILLDGRTRIVRFLFARTASSRLQSRRVLKWTSGHALLGFGILRFRLRSIIVPRHQERSMGWVCQCNVRLPDRYSPCRPSLQRRWTARVARDWSSIASFHMRRERTVEAHDFELCVLFHSRKIRLMRRGVP